MKSFLHLKKNWKHFAVENEEKSNLNRNGQHFSIFAFSTKAKNGKNVRCCVTSFRSLSGGTAVSFF